MPVNVDIPETLRVFNIVCSATSKLPFASIEFAKVDKPVTFRLSDMSNDEFKSNKSVNVVTAFILTAPLKVETPDTVKASISAVPFKYKSFHC